MTRITCGFLLAVAVACWPVALPGQPSIPQSADFADGYDNFGASVQVQGNRLLVGPVRGRKGSGPEIFLFVRDGSGQWTREGAFPSGWRQFPVQGISGYRGGRANWRVLSMRDPWLFVGNPHENVAGAVDAGAVHVYQRSAEGWTEHAVLQSPAVAAGSGFGNSTAFDGTWLAVGQPGTNQTHVYRLNGTTFVHHQVLLPTTAVSVGFGSEAEFAGNQLFVRVGSELHVHALAGGNWAMSQVLTQSMTGLGATSPFALDGEALGVASGTQLRMFRRTSGAWAADGAVLVVPDGLSSFAIRDGSEIHAAGHTGSQTLHWRRNGGVWSAPTALPYPAEHVASATRINSVFASFSFDFDADRLYMGARFTSFNRVISQGAAYAFGMASGLPQFERTFRHGNGWLGDSLGKWIANDGDWMAASANGTDVSDGASILRDVGAVHLYRRRAEGWTRVQTLSAPAGQAFDGFGEVVSLRGDLAVIGSMADYQGIDDHGRFHVFRRSAGDSWSLLCELLPPVTPTGSLAWRNDDELSDFQPMQPAVSDGEHIVAVYRNRAYAWRTTPSECLPPSEIPIPDRAAVPGAPGTIVPSQLVLSWFRGMSVGRLLLTEQGGLIDVGGGSTASTPTRVMVYDYTAGQWARSFVYTAQTGDTCGTKFSGQFTNRTTLEGICVDIVGGNRVYSIVTWTESAGAWSSQVVPLPAFPAEESPSGILGSSLITETTVSLPNGDGRQFRVREPPGYAISETLTTTPACWYPISSDFPRYSADDIFLACRQADGANGRGSGELRIFSRNLPGRSLRAFDPDGQLLLPPASIEIRADGFESVPP